MFRAWFCSGDDGVSVGPLDSMNIQLAVMNAILDEDVADLPDGRVINALPPASWVTDLEDVGLSNGANQ